MTGQINPFPFAVILLASCFIAGVLSLIVLPDWVFYFRPDWLALVVIYWVLAFPHKLAVGYGLICGLFLDLILVKPLGLNAVGFVILAYLVSHWSSQIRALSLWQQCLFLGVLLCFCKLVIGLMSILVTDFVFTQYYWYSMFGNIIFWPVVYIVLRAVRLTFLTPNEE